MVLFLSPSQERATGTFSLICLSEPEKGQRSPEALFNLFLYLFLKNRENINNIISFLYGPVQADSMSAARSSLGTCDVSCQLLSYLQKIILASLEVVNNS